MKIDFSVIDNLTKPQASPRSDFKGSGRDKRPGNPKALRTQNRALKSEISPGALYLLEKEKAARQRYIRASEAYQENIRKAGTLRNEIQKGIARGEDPAVLLIKALECIACMTGEKHFYTHGKEALIAIHGSGLNNKAMISEELRDTRARLQMLSRPELMTDKPPEAQRHIQRAIREHEKIIEGLEKLL